jgi:hypothetical protein
MQRKLLSESHTVNQWFGFISLMAQFFQQVCRGLGTLKMLYR